MTDEQSPSEGQLEAQRREAPTLLERELAAWEREDREEASEIAAIERQIADQTLRIAELEKSWEKLGERAASYAERAGELERELGRLEEVAASARGARRAATAELTRAERRAVDAESRLLEVESLQDAKRTLEGKLEGSRADADRYEAQAAGLTAAHERLKRDLEQTEERLAEQEVEKRALLADLARTRSILEARSEQLHRLSRSKWLRLARVTWRARQRRQHAVAILLIAATFAAAIVTVLVVYTP
jgi:chromosome segregation ATPase